MTSWSHVGGQPQKLSFQVCFERLDFILNAWHHITQELVMSRVQNSRQRGNLNLSNDKIFSPRKLHFRIPGRLYLSNWTFRSCSSSYLRHHFCHDADIIHLEIILPADWLLLSNSSHFLAAAHCAMPNAHNTALLLVPLLSKSRLHLDGSPLEQSVGNENRFLHSICYQLVKGLMGNCDPCTVIQISVCILQLWHTLYGTIFKSNVST